MPRAEWEILLAHTIQAQVEELRELAASGELSVDDHDRVGLLMTHNIAHFISLSDKAWRVLHRFILESRRVQAIPHEPDPTEAKK